MHSRSSPTAPLRNEDSSVRQRQTYRRRPHKKSKAGCAECRKRRVKCSEEKPICRLCNRHSTPCIYPQASAASPLSEIRAHGSQEPEKSSDVPSSSGALRSSAKSISPRSESRRVPEASSIAAAEGLPRPSTVPISSTSELWSRYFNIDDLALLHHWTLSTSLCILKSPEVSRYWQVVFPEIGFRYPFVMYGILSLAALHRALAHPEQTRHLGLVSAHHYNKALRGYQENVDHMCIENSDALFAFACINILYVFAIYGPESVNNDDYLSPTTQTSRILGAEWIPIIRGVGSVLHSVSDGVRLGPLRSLLDLGNWEELDPDQVAGDDHFGHLNEIWAQSCDADVYTRTLYLLRRSHMYMTQFETLDNRALDDWSYNREWSAPLIWLQVAPEEFFIRLHQRQPFALLIFAYFGTLLHALNGYWFLKGWGKSIVTVVDELLGDYWRPWTEWPRSIVWSS